MEGIDKHEGRVVIVTGASRGIGKAIARQFIENGDRVVMVADDVEELRGAVATFDSEATVLTLSGDLADGGFLQQILDHTLSKWGRVDILINNAAWRTLETLRTISLDTWEKTIRVCLTAPVFLSKLVAASMESRLYPGVIVNISSIMAERAGGTSPAYVASKGALLSMTYEMAALYGPSGIRVVAVCPGNVHTALSTDFMDRAGNNISQRLVQDMENQTPLKRSATPQEIANGVFWLCSSEASFVTGTSIQMDGGFSHNFSSYTNKKSQFPNEF